MEVDPVSPPQFVFADFPQQSCSVPTGPHDNSVDFEDQRSQILPCLDGASIVGCSDGRSDSLEFASSRYTTRVTDIIMGNPCMPLTTGAQPDATSFHHP